MKDQNDRLFIAVWQVLLVTQQLLVSISIINSDGNKFRSNYKAFMYSLMELCFNEKEKL